MTALDYINLIVGIVTLLGMLAGLAKFFFTMQKALDLLKMETKGHIAGLKKDIEHLANNGIQTLKDNQERCMLSRKSTEKELFDLQRKVSDKVIALETRAKQ